MKRDMELIRELLLAIESQNQPDFLSEQLEPVITHGNESVSYHLQLLMDASFIEAQIFAPQESYDSVRIKRLTWEGHEFLDNARNESIWKAAKEIVTQKGVSIENVGFGVLTQILASVAKQYFGLK